MRDSTAPLFAPENNLAMDPAPLEALSAAVGSAVPVVPALPDYAEPVVAAPPARQRAVPYQPSLFQEIGNVIPFRPPDAPKPRRPRSKGQTVKKNQQQPAAESLSFEFALPDMPGEGGWMGEQGLAPGELAGQTPAGAAAFRTPQSDIYCDEQVGPIPARILAAAMDLGLVTLAYAVFASIYYLLVHAQTGEAAPIGWSWKLALPYMALYLVVAALYKSLYAFANIDSPGTRWANLKIVNFDGEAPSRAERVSRMAWSGLSIAAVGMGLFWSLVDDENLTWHDLLSKTFPVAR